MLGTGRRAHQSTAALGLGNKAFAVGVHLCNREAEPVKVGDDLVGRICKISTGDLPRALEEMAHDNPACQKISIVCAQIEFVHQRREVDGRVPDSSSHHERRALLQAVDNGVRRNVRVRRHEIVAEVSCCLIRVFYAKVEFVDELSHVVSDYRGHFGALQSEITTELHRQI